MTGQPLAELLRTAVPEDAAVLALVRPDTPPGPEPVALPGQTVAVVPVQPGPGAAEHAAGLLRLLELADPETERAAADRLRSRLASGGPLRLNDALTGSQALLTLEGGSWRERAGMFSAGSVHTAPNGSLRWDPAAPPSADRLTGQVAVKGWPVVTGAPGTDPAQLRQYYERLAALTHFPLVVTFEHGAVTDMKPASGGSGQAAAALGELVGTAAGGGAVTAVEFGVALGRQPLPFNTQANLASARTAGPSVRLWLGQLSRPGWQVSLECATSVLSDEAGTPLAGALAAPRRRLNRVSSAGCGCH
ncbi:hypothetical protein ACFYW9_29555 [Streptomyces sp. NPDC002698]|uniref:hypothetical protein n=1 Tax=Streptomyces sp. NPDC002698 TaxID=3364660 RepID=UPI0036C8293C